MNSIDAVLKRMESYGEQSAVFFQGSEMSYFSFMQHISDLKKKLAVSGIKNGTVCAVLGEFCPTTCMLFFALMEVGAIIVPFTRTIQNEIRGFMDIAGVEVLITIDSENRFEIQHESPKETNPLIASFRERNSPGLVVFSSGSTGKPKGILHDCENVMRKFVVERPGWRTLLFLLMDHFGGFNTFLGSFAYGGVAVCIGDRKPESVCKAIEASGATLLPTTPTFINLLITSGAYHTSNLSSIKLITYGTEVMPEITLQKVRGIFPNAVIKQTYGLSELGVLRSKSENDASLWVKIGGDGFEVKVSDGMLWVRSEANMVGYLNAPSPFDSEGWMCTGDQVEVNGEYMRILGRKSEMINVGGQKVFPAEVETVLLEAANVKDATVYSVKHPLMGNVVQARVSLVNNEDTMQAIERLRALCSTRLAKFKIPVKFIITTPEECLYSERYKKTRAGIEGAKV